MADFVQKSDRNEEAVELLNKFNYYDQAIHCSYYACLQFIMFFNIKKGIDETSLKYAVSQSKQKGQGTNAAYISLMLNYIKRIDVRMFRNLTRDVGKLKTLRTDADYSERMLSILESEEAFRLAKSVKSELKGIIKI